MSNTTEKFKKILQDYVNKSYDELLAIAKNAFCNAMNFFAQFDKDKNGATVLVPVVSSILGSDGKLTALEYQFLKDLVGDIEYETLKSSVQAHYGEEWENAIDNLIDSCNDEMKATVLTLITCFAAVDETVTVDEQRYIYKLLT